MARLAHADLIDNVETILQDSTNIYYAAVDLAVYLLDALREFSKYVPYLIKETLTTTASKELDISVINNRNNLLSYVEYKVDQDPIQKKNWEWVDYKTIRMLIDSTPTADEDVYVFVEKTHLVPDIAKLDGAVDLPAGYAAGLSTIHVDGLTAGATLLQDMQFKIASDSTGTMYRLTEDTVLESGGEGDITFLPVLAEAIAQDDAVTFENSTLEPQQEPTIVNLTAAIAQINKANYYLPRVTGPSATVWKDTLSTGQFNYNNIIQQLKAMRLPKTNERFPRG